MISCTEQGEAVSAAMVNHYNGKGSLISNSFGDYSTYYTYDGYNQLTRVDNESSPEMYTSMYTYDERGNILSKKVYDYTKNENITSSPKESISFGYAGSGWKDQLVSVNGTELTYDANGNVLTYGEKSYAWEKGRQLSEITDGESTYSYTYDENGIRNSKTVNGETTYINSLNGTVLSQKCGENTMYFQYRNGVPVGFVYNGTQYLYITNQQNDVIAITDAGGGTMAAYYYDEWGKLLGIETAADSEEQMEIAHANPIRYRGYYYDNETGYYYLQSRYYDPSICRFINADSFSYINNYSEFSKNAYAYCKNNPIMYVDADGTSPDILTNLSKVWGFLKSIANDIGGLIQNHLNVLKDFFDIVFISKFDILFDALKFNFGFSLKNQMFFTKTDNIWEIVLKSLVISIEIDTFTDAFEELIKAFKPSFNFNDWYKSLNDSFIEILDDLFLASATLLNTWFVNASDIVLDFIQDFTFDKIIGFLFEEIGIQAYLDILIDMVRIGDSHNNGQYTGFQSIFTFLYNTVITVLPIVFPEAKYVQVITEILSILNDIFYDGIINFINGEFWGV